LKVARQVFHFSVDQFWDVIYAISHLCGIFFPGCINVNVKFSHCDNKERSPFEQTVCVFNCFLDFLTTKTTKNKFPQGYKKTKLIKKLLSSITRKPEIRKIAVKAKFQS